MSEPIVAIACVANVFVRQMSFEKAGDIEQGHAHPFDHITFLSRGRLRVSVKGSSREFSAPQMILIRKDQQHELTALEDGTEVSCIHALRDEAGEIVGPDMLVTQAEREAMMKQLRGTK